MVSRQMISDFELVFSIKHNRCPESFEFHFGVCSLLAPCPGFKFLHLKHASFFIKSVRSIGTFTVGLEKRTSVPCLGVLCSSILRMARAFQFVEQGAGLGHFWNSRGGSNVSESLVLLGL